MPSKNRVKFYAPESYYHAYNRGSSKQTIFHYNDDYVVFLNLLKRHLSPEPQRDKKNREYMWLHNDIELLAYCLMPNHFHLLVYQRDEQALSKLLKQVSMSYVTYYNKKYSRIGPLFQDVYKASLIQNDAYLHHISRYIHLNPKNYMDWKFSSLPSYIGAKQAEWLKPERMLDLFESKQAYLTFVEDYEDYKKQLEDIKSELANS